PCTRVHWRPYMESVCPVSSASMRDRSSATSEADATSRVFLPMKPESSCQQNPGSPAKNSPQTNNSPPPSPHVLVCGGLVALYLTPSTREVEVSDTTNAEPPG